jgi:DNA-binding NarL/FixJ family response regulator
MKFIKHQRTPFLLTPTEKRILDMRRSGMKCSEITLALGWKEKSVGYVGSMLSRAAEKDRCQILDDRSKGQGSSLSKARGATRMQGTL